MSGYVNRLRPLQHRLLVRVSPIDPDTPFFPGFGAAPQDLLPQQLPAYVRKRLVDFLEGRHRVPPTYLQSLISPSEAGEARRAYRELLASGYTQGEAVVNLGLVSPKPYFNLTRLSYADIIRASGVEGCGPCESLRGVEAALVHTTAGEEIEAHLRIVRCHEVLAATDQRNAAARAVERERKRQRERLASAERAERFRSLTRRAG